MEANVYRSFPVAVRHAGNHPSTLSRSGDTLPPRALSITKELYFIAIRYVKEKITCLCRSRFHDAGLAPGITCSLDQLSADGTNARLESGKGGEDCDMIG